MVFSIAKFLRGTIFTTGNLWLLKKLHCKKSIHWVLLKRKTPGSRRTESAVLDWITRPSYVFPLRIQRILWTQFRGSGAFSNVTGAGGEGGGLIVHHAKRIHVPLLKFLRMPFAWLCGTKSCFIACDLNSFRIVHYQMILDIFWVVERVENVCLQRHAQLIANSIL